MLVWPVYCGGTREMTINEVDLSTLRDAVGQLENPSLAIRISSAIGMPVEAVARELGKKAPPAVVDAVTKSSHGALEFVLKNSLRSVKDGKVSASPRLHTAAALTTGAVAGFVGIQALIVELPLTTGIMFRSIADIARAEGESPQDPETVLNCMQVFAMGSQNTSKDDAAETSYYGVRVALSKTVGDALQYVVSSGAAGAGAPALVRFISTLAHRFGIVVTQKALAQTLPVIGAIGGGLVNTMFISHFQDMARSHFAIRRLERQYGAEPIRAAYLEISSGKADAMTESPD